MAILSKNENRPPKTPAPKAQGKAGVSATPKAKRPTQKKETPEKAAERKRNAEAKDAMAPVLDEFSPAAKKKPESEAKAKERARREKEDANREKPTGIQKAIFSERHEDKIEAKKAKAKKANEEPKGISQKEGDGKSEKQELKERIERITNGLEEVLSYAESFSHRAKYKDKDPKKVIYGVLLGFPEPPVYDTDLALFLGIDRRTLYNWRLDKDVVSVRTEFVETYFRSHTPAVIQALVDGTQRRSWVNGLADTAAIKLFLQYVEKWNEKSEVDVKSDGKAIAWNLAPSQFVKADKIPKSQE